VASLVALVRDFFSQRIVLGTNTLSVAWGQFIFEFALPIVGVYLVIRLIVFFVKRLVARSQLKEEVKNRIMRWFRRVYRLLFLVAIVVLAISLFGDEVNHSLSSVFTFLREPFFVSGNTQISVVTLLLLVPIFYVASWAGSGTRRFLEAGVLERLSLDASRRFSIVSLTRYGVMAVVAIIGLSIVGINLSSLAVIFGVLGIGLGFGLQGVISNFFAGIVIMFSRPIKEGDRIHIGDLEGDVIHIRLLYSVVNTITRETIVIPNRHITENPVHNQSYEDPSIILFTDVQVSYTSDLDRVNSTLLQVGLESEYRHGSRPPRVLFRSFDDSGITVTLALPIRNATERHQARSAVIMDIWRIFKKSGIEIPFPQRDVHIKHFPQTDNWKELKKGMPDGAVLEDDSPSGDASDDETPPGE
jgi:potassium-dependent mechanosensitive channel